jgi:3-dehydroquinate dehydratase-2
MRKVLVLHGPNLNLLGEREPDVYGHFTLEEINKDLEERAGKLGLELKIAQSNHEGELVEAIQNARSWADVILINPAAYTHTSVAIRDAIAAVKVPVIEVHRPTPLAVRDSAIPPISPRWPWASSRGFGKQSYLLALEAAVTLGLGR